MSNHSPFYSVWHRKSLATEGKQEQHVRPTSTGGKFTRKLWKGTTECPSNAACGEDAPWSHHLDISDSVHTQNLGKRGPRVELENRPCVSDDFPSKTISNHHLIWWCPISVFDYQRLQFSNLAALLEFSTKPQKISKYRAVLTSAGLMEPEFLKTRCTYIKNVCVCEKAYVYTKYSDQ